MQCRLIGNMSIQCDTRCASLGNDLFFANLNVSQSGRPFCAVKIGAVKIFDKGRPFIKCVLMFFIPDSCL